MIVIDIIFKNNIYIKLVIICYYKIEGRELRFKVKYFF